MIKVSVVIPVYNVEKYLRQCVDSVVSQTYPYIEVILVDDGATDDSSSICDYYADIDDRVKVIHKKNGGLSDARNVGILAASGDYIAFLDSDDYWDDNNVLEKLVRRVKLTNADVLNYAYCKVYENSDKKIEKLNISKDMPVSFKSKGRQIDFLFDNSLYVAAAWNKMIRRSLIDEELLFPIGIVSEDIAWCARLLDKAQSVDYISETVYAYRQREGSITHSKGEKTLKDLSYNIIETEKIGRMSDAETQKYLFMYDAFQLSTFLSVQARTDMFYKQYVQMLKSYAWLLKYHGHNRRVTLLSFGTKLLGFTNMCKILRLTRKIWSRN